MDIKKKPPPGATLISRLKEGRLRREQALAEKQGAKDAGAQESPPQPELKASEDVPVMPPAEEQIGTDATIPASAPSNKRVAARVRSTPAELAPSNVPAVVTPAPVDLIHRHISIEDLRPKTDEYGQLTEEIKLAGRFAAAGLIAQGLRLSRLKDDQIYKNHYPSFEEYCRKEHSMTATYAYRLIRMSEMAERLAEEGARTITEGVHEMPDPFEVMLALGHRHLMAILPLETEKAEDLLIRGVPLPDESGQPGQRIPIVQATEQQIRAALKMLDGAAGRPKLKKAPLAVPSTASVQTLADMADKLDEWAAWLEKNRPVDLIIQLMEEVRAGRIKEGKEVARLAHQLGEAGKRIQHQLDLLLGADRSKKQKP